MFIFEEPRVAYEFTVLIDRGTGAAHAMVITRD